MVGDRLPITELPRPDQTLTEPSPHPDLSGHGGKNRMPPVNVVGEPCTGEPHARFAGGSWKRSTRPRTRRRTPSGKPKGRATSRLPIPLTRLGKTTHHRCGRCLNPPPCRPARGCGRDGREDLAAWRTQHSRGDDPLVGHPDKHGRQQREPTAAERTGFAQRRMRSISATAQPHAPAGATVDRRVHRRLVGAGAGPAAAPCFPAGDTEDPTR
jgi:hypothetical protein